jgi:serine-type D-Ala-D-Ala carboxypeptidase
MIGHMMDFEKLPYLSPIINRYASEHYFRGAVVRVQHEGQVFEQAWGYARYDSQMQEVLTPEYLFDLASLSKLFTTVAILRLITLGDLGEHTVVNDVLQFTAPEVRRILSTKDIVSLMTHSSGLRAWFPFYTMRDECFESILSHILTQFPMELGMVYSDINYMLLGKIIERIVQMPLDKAMDRLVFKPLGMQSATYRPEASQTAATEFGNRIEERMVQGMALHFDAWRAKDTALRGAPDDGNCFYYFQGVSGHAGIFANAADVVKLGSVFTGSHGSFLESDLLSRAITDYGAGRGYGVQFGGLYPQDGFGHTGFTGTYLYINPKHDLLVTALTNRLHVQAPKDLTAFRKDLVASVSCQTPN